MLAVNSLDDVIPFYEEFFEELRGVEKDGVDFEILRKPFNSEQIVLTAKSILGGPIEL